MAYDDDTDDSAMSNEAVAEAAGLIYVHEDDPGLTRVKSEAGFDYFDAKGRPVTDPKAIDRIRALAIPPAYADVWISKSARGHIQATGRDEQVRSHGRLRTRPAGAAGQGRS